MKDKTMAEAEKNENWITLKNGVHIPVEEKRDTLYQYQVRKA